VAGGGVLLPVVVEAGSEAAAGGTSELPPAGGIVELLAAGGTTVETVLVVPTAAGVEGPAATTGSLAVHGGLGTNMPMKPPEADVPEVDVFVSAVAVVVGGALGGGVAPE
jgi:hypothetical protein